MTQRLQILTKWRSVYKMMATMGSVAAFEREVSQTHEKILLLRAENNALMALLVQKGVFTGTEFAAQLDVEAEHLCEQYEKAFPGFKATETGLTMDAKLAAQTMGGWKR